MSCDCDGRTWQEFRKLIAGTHHGACGMHFDPLHNPIEGRDVRELRVEAERLVIERRILAHEAFSFPLGLLEAALQNQALIFERCPALRELAALVGNDRCRLRRQILYKSRAR